MAAGFSYVCRFNISHLTSHLKQAPALYGAWVVPVGQLLTFCMACAGVQVLLSELWAEKRKQHPVRSIFSTLPTPQLTFRAGPLPTRPPPLLPYR